MKLRLDRDQELSFLEFNYMILQAYDFVELHRRHGCVLQMGGSDQWGNIVNGIDLGRRMGTEQLYALTCPLITTSSGAKMGKTAQGAVWLNAEQLSPYEYWQFWRNTEDDDVGRFLRLFTELPLDEIARLENLAGAEINEAKKVLANEATALLHGKEAADGRRGDGAEDLRGRRERRRAADRSTCRAPSSKRALGCRRSSCAPGSPARTARCGAPSPTMRVSVNDVRVDRSAAHDRGAATSTPTAWSSCRSGARSTPSSCPG